MREENDEFDRDAFEIWMHVVNWDILEQKV